MKKSFISLVMISASLTMGTKIYFADEIVSYDLTNHQPIEYFTIDEDGETVEIIVIDDSNNQYSLMSGITDKTYTISKNKPNSWSISYKVSIKNKKITSAYGGNFTATQGSFSNTSVTKASDYLAIGKGAWKYRAATNTIQVKASISNNNLNIQ